MFLKFSRLAPLLFLLIAGCFQTTSDDADLRTVPVTNNPHVVPNHGGGFPGAGAPAAGPY